MELPAIQICNPLNNSLTFKFTMFKILHNVWKTYINLGSSEVRFLKKELARWDGINAEIDKATADNNMERLRQISKAISNDVCELSS